MVSAECSGRSLIGVIIEPKELPVFLYLGAPFQQQHPHPQSCVLVLVSHYKMPANTRTHTHTPALKEWESHWATRHQLRHVCRLWNSPPPQQRGRYSSSIVFVATKAEIINPSLPSKAWMCGLIGGGYGWLMGSCHCFLFATFPHHKPPLLALQLLQDSTFYWLYQISSCWDAGIENFKIILRLQSNTWNMNTD